MIDIDTKLLRPIAAKFNLSLTSFGEPVTDPSAPSYGSVTLSRFSASGGDPAPISPYKGSAAFDIFSGTIKGVYNTHRGLEGDDNIKVYPSYMNGNTGRASRSSYMRVGWRSHTPIDTRYYWKLSDNIYRYNHKNQIEGPGNIHTVNESMSLSPFAFLQSAQTIVDISIDSFLEMIEFFTTLILNADEATYL